MTGTVTVESMDGAAAARAEPEFKLVYAEVFAEEPYEETPESVDANFRRFRSQVRKATFRAALARTGEGVPVGIAYGYPLSPHTGWWDRLITPVDDELRREDGHRTFGLMELAVRAPWRRLGVARRMHEAVLTGTTTVSACCSTHDRTSRPRRPRTGRGATTRWGRPTRGRARSSTTSWSWTCEVAPTAERSGTGPGSRAPPGGGSGAAGGWSRDGGRGWGRRGGVLDAYAYVWRRPPARLTVPGTGAVNMRSRAPHRRPRPRHPPTDLPRPRTPPRASSSQDGCTTRASRGEDARQLTSFSIASKMSASVSCCQPGRSGQSATYPGFGSSKCRYICAVQHVATKRPFCSRVSRPACPSLTSRNCRTCSYTAPAAARSHSGVSSQGVT